MKRIAPAFIGLIGLTCLTFAAPVAAEMYTWKDAEGRVHFSDKPPPASTRVKPAKVKPRRESPPEAAQPALGDGPPAVVLYSGECGLTCSNARALLDKRGIPYTYKDVQADAEAGETLMKLTGAPNVPVLTIGSNVHKGFQTQLWHTLLDAAGFGRQPASTPPPPAE